MDAPLAVQITANSNLTSHCIFIQLCPIIPSDTPSLVTQAGQQHAGQRDCLRHGSHGPHSAAAVLPGFPREDSVESNVVFRSVRRNVPASATGKFSMHTFRNIPTQTTMPVPDRFSNILECPLCIVKWHVWQPRHGRRNGQHQPR
jgi:hypothetical protein